MLQPLVCPCSKLSRKPLRWLIGTRYFEYDCVDVIERLRLDFHTGRAVELLWTLEGLNTAQQVDRLQRAKWYLERTIAIYPNLEHDSTQNAIAEIDGLLNRLDRNHCPVESP